MMTKMPADAVGMRAHMTGEPPAGHGMSVEAGMSMPDMRAEHASMHDGGADHAHSGMTRTSGTQMFDRAIPVELDYEIRSIGDAAPRFTGYASVFNSDSEPLPFIETVMPGSFARTLSQTRDHTFVIDHDDTRLLASRRAKTLTLTEDTRGLLVEADLPNTSYARDLVELHSRGEARSMSFTFGVARGGDMWSDDRKRRTLSDLKLGHVTVLTGLAPAYRQTTASIRSLAFRFGADAEALTAAFDDLREGRTLTAEAVDLLHAAITELRGAPPETPITAGAVPAISLSTARARLALLAKAR